MCDFSLSIHHPLLPLSPVTPGVPGTQFANHSISPNTVLIQVWPLGGLFWMSGLCLLEPPREMGMDWGWEGSGRII